MKLKIYTLAAMSIAENLKHIQKRIDEAASRMNVPPPSMPAKLVAVSKFQSMESIKQALDAGHRCFGENRVQEAQLHWADLKPSYPDLELHLIGPLQSNKAADAVALFDVIETLDRKKLARVLGDEMQKQARSLPCFIQVNTGEESQKAGIAPSDLSDFLAFCHDECKIEVRGLMCIPPLEDPPALHFALLRQLAQEHDLPQLSMGMSADFEKAVVLGASYVRVGSAIFGDRV